MSMCLIMIFVSIASNGMAMTTPYTPSSTQELMQLSGIGTGGNWNGINGRGQGRGISEREAFQAILGIYNVPISSGINPATTGGISSTNPIMEQIGRMSPMDAYMSGLNSRMNSGMGSQGISRTNPIIEQSGRMSPMDGFMSGLNSRMNSGMGSQGINSTNPIMEQSGRVSPMDAFMSGLNSRMNSGMGWQGRNGGMSGATQGGFGGVNLGMGNGGRRSNVDKSIRTQATLNSQDEVLLRRAGAGCTQDWTHVNGGVDPFCIRLLQMYPNRGL